MCHTHAPGNRRQRHPAEVYVFAEAHLREAPEPQVDIAAYAHVERPWVKLVELFLAAAYAPGGEEACHRVAYGLLRVGERRVGAVGPAKGVGRRGGQFVGNGLQVARRHHDVGVEHYEPLALGALGAVVAAGPRPGVLLGKVSDVELAGILLGHSPAVALGAVFHYYDLKVFHCLRGEALEQLGHFVGAVVYGYDDGVFAVSHVCWSAWRRALGLWWWAGPRFGPCLYPENAQPIIRIIGRLWIVHCHEVPPCLWWRAVYVAPWRSLIPSRG